MTNQAHIEAAIDNPKLFEKEFKKELDEIIPAIHQMVSNGDASALKRELAWLYKEVYEQVQPEPEEQVDMWAEDQRERAHDYRKAS